MDRWVCAPAEVVDVDGPRALIRAYFEQRGVRKMLMVACRPDSHASAAACDVGCGFGRLTPVLTEFAARVVASKPADPARALNARARSSG